MCFVLKALLTSDNACTTVDQFGAALTGPGVEPVGVGIPVTPPIAVTKASTYHIKFVLTLVVQKHLLPILTSGDSITADVLAPNDKLLLLNIPISPSFFVLNKILSELIKTLFPSYGLLLNLIQYQV